jgi:NAD(P)-dependent dehydrogenase (short-subunit alcohol dehydrogenase family)
MPDADIEGVPVLAIVVGVARPIAVAPPLWSSGPRHSLPMSKSFVVTGGGRGVGRAIVERLVADSDAFVVVIEFDPSSTEWMNDHPARTRLVEGDAADPSVTASAADAAESVGRLAGWVNNAAVFRDAALHSTPVDELINLVGLNLNPAIVGSATAVQRMVAAGAGGAIVNVSSHQATRAVRGALAYVTAKSAIEGLTRAVAVDYGAQGIRANAVALGSIRTDRLDDYLERQTPERAHAIEADLRKLHPIGRPGTVDEVADVVNYLLSEQASFINGAIVPVDGGRSVLGLDPEAI